MHSRIPPTLTPEEISNLSKQIGTKNSPVRAPLKSILPDHFPLLLREAMAAEIDKDIHSIRNSPSRAFCRLMHHFLFHEQMIITYGGHWWDWLPASCLFCMSLQPGLSRDRSSGARDFRLSIPTVPTI